MSRIARLAAVAAFGVTMFGGDAFAQKLPTLRVANDSATVRTRPTFLSDVVGKPKACTMLEAIDLENGWYWVILPPDEHGTRFRGWVREHDVEIVAAGDPTSVLRHFSEAVEQAKARMDAEAAAQEARLEQARQRVAEARREYEAMAQKAGAALPATAAAPAASQTRPARVPRSDKPQSSVPRQYEWFGGYSFYRDQSDSHSFPAGWALSVGRPVRPDIDVVGSISSSHKSESLFGVNVTTSNMYTFAAGPKYARRTGSATAFGQVLVGIATMRTSAFGVSDSSTGFALQPGAGVDIPIAKTLAVRLGFDVETVRSSGGWFTGFRINTGVMFVTGAKP